MPQELETGRPAPGSAKAVPALTLSQARSGRLRAHSPPEDEPTSRRFKLGDAVRARNINPSGYTRLPRYARGKTGVVAGERGVHILADANAAGPTTQRERLSSVRFSAHDLWGDGAIARDAVVLDLWDSHLEPA